ncbi:hypothetical protein IEQ34_002731 [Dendrobium chrysotoxum]|uniref:Uncharacterized protein n=1 Tax=Dendrobium chrysotoxum TaxID=161865 RepID=A0AAV7HI29_DENCH|nr:hypothetical protein IEQ34_002731 [Dendrobium chrysotoxum]
MGNCMERCDLRSQAKKIDKRVFQVRVVLTRAELELLMQQMEKKPGLMKLEAVIAKMAERPSLKEAKRWRPTLESIMEVYEVWSFESSDEIMVDV